jgi:hypothetical protein
MHAGWGGRVPGGAKWQRRPGALLSGFVEVVHDKVLEIVERKSMVLPGFVWEPGPSASGARLPHRGVRLPQQGSLATARSASWARLPQSRVPGVRLRCTPISGRDTQLRTPNSKLTTPNSQLRTSATHHSNIPIFQYSNIPAIRQNGLRARLRFTKVRDKVRDKGFAGGPWCGKSAWRGFGI